MWLGFLSGGQDAGTPRPPFGKLTRLSVDGYGAKRAGSFFTKTTGAHEPAKITRLSVDGYGAKRAGSFAGRGDQVLAAAAGTSTVTAEGAPFFQAPGSSAGVGAAAAIADFLSQAVASAAGTSTVAASSGIGDHPVGRITRLAVDGYGAKRTGSFASKSGAVGIGTSSAVGAAAATGRSTWQAAGFSETPQGVRFDGVDDGLRRSTALSGVADNAVAGSFAACMGFRGGSGSARGLFQDSTAAVWFYRKTTGAMEFIVSDGLGASLTVTSSITIPDDAVYHSILFSYRTDFSAGNKLRSLAIDGVADPSPTVVDSSASFNLDWASVLTDLVIMRQLQGPFSFTQGDMAYVWMAIGDSTKYIDFGVSANVDKFIDGTGKFRPLGASGEIPLSAPAQIYQKGPSAFIGTNRGTGGDFTVNDAPTDGAGTPLGFGSLGTALAVSSIIGVGVGSAAGTSTATAVPDASSGVAASSGTSTATAVALSDVQTVGSSGGTSTATAVGLGAGTGVGSADGTSTVTGVGASVWQADASAAGTSTASAVMSQFFSGAGEAAGDANVLGVGQGSGLGVASSTGFASVLGFIVGGDSAAAAADGTATVLGVSAALVNIIGSAAGTSTVTAVGRAVGWVPTTEGTDTWTEVSTTTDIWTAVTEGTDPWTEV